MALHPSSGGWRDSCPAAPHQNTGILLEQSPERNGMGRTSESMFMYSKLVSLGKQGLESWLQPPCFSLSALLVSLSHP